MNNPSRRKALRLVGVAGLTVLGYEAVRLATSPQPKAAAAARVRDIPPRRRPASWTRGPLMATEKPVQDLGDISPRPPRAGVALTIDDGPHPQWTPQVLDLLAEHQVTATFFLIGQQIGQYPKLARRIADAGHQICNHTMTHPQPFGDLSVAEIRKEIVEAHHSIADTTGILPTSFRAPGGSWTQPVLDVATEHGMLPVDWSIDPRDWSRPGVDQIRDALLAAKTREILLCHDGGGNRSQTIEALREVIPALKKRKLTFVHL